MPKYSSEPPFEGKLTVTGKANVRHLATVPKPVILSNWKKWNIELDPTTNSIVWNIGGIEHIVNDLLSKLKEKIEEVFEMSDNSDLVPFISYYLKKDISQADSWDIEFRTIDSIKRPTKLVWNNMAFDYESEDILDYRVLIKPKIQLKSLLSDLMINKAKEVHAWKWAKYDVSSKLIEAISTIILSGRIVFHQMAILQRIITVTLNDEGFSDLLKVKYEAETAEELADHFKLDVLYVKELTKTLIKNGFIHETTRSDKQTVLIMTELGKSFPSKTIVSISQKFSVVHIADKLGVREENKNPAYGISWGVYPTEMDAVKAIQDILDKNKTIRDGQVTSFFSHDDFKIVKVY